ncbi:MAG: FtsW/RodA/SpoVE family cell cycle protein, partial [Arenimonas sp.]
RALSIGKRCVELRLPFQGYVAFGIGLWISLQALVSMGVNMGILPTKGLTLPLISSGGSSVLMTCAALGVLLRVSYELDRAERRQAARVRGDLARSDPDMEAGAASAIRPSYAGARPSTPVAMPVSRGNTRIEPRFGVQR